MGADDCWGSMPAAIEQWIKRRCEAAVAAGLGEWLDGSATQFGLPIYRVTDGPVTLVLSEMGLSYDGPPAPFECRYDQIKKLDLARLSEIMAREGDLLPRSEHSRLLTLSILNSGDQRLFAMQFTLRVYNQVASVLPHIVDDLARRELGSL